jgi:hypothetical protein
MASHSIAPRRQRLSPANRRGDERHPVVISSASARPHGAQPVEAKLTDVSAFGCRIACTEDYPEETRLWLRLAGSMPIAATVMWCEGGVVGCRFDQPIDPRLMRTLIRPVH